MNSLPPYRADYTLLVWDGPAKQFLVLEDGTFPAFTSSENITFSPGRVQEQAREMGLNIRVLRRSSLERDDPHNRARLCFEVEWADASVPLPSSARWATDPDELCLEPQRFRVREAFKPEINAQRQPWTQTGWWRQVLPWIDAQLAYQGRTRLGPPRQIRTSQLSSVSQMSTDGGEVYFKAVPAYFRLEMRLTPWLERHFPTRIPRALGVDPARGWMLLSEFEGAPLGAQTSLEAVQQALRDYAELQIACIPHLEALRSLGVPDHPLERLSEQIHALLYDDFTLHRPGARQFLTGEQIERLRGFELELERRVARLEAFDLPNTLEHGDLWQNNVQIVAGHGFFFDWTDANLTHPLLSLPLGTFETGPWGDAVIMDAYLEPWTRFAPLERLCEALKDAQPLAELHRAIHYHRDLLPELEDRSECEGHLIWHLSRALDALT